MKALLIFLLLFTPPITSFANEVDAQANSSEQSEPERWCGNDCEKYQTEKRGEINIPLTVLRAAGRTVSYLNAVNPLYWANRLIAAPIAANLSGVSEAQIKSANSNDMLRNPLPIWDPVHSEAELSRDSDQQKNSER